MHATVITLLSFTKQLGCGQPFIRSWDSAMHAKPLATVPVRTSSGPIPFRTEPMGFDREQPALLPGTAADAAAAMTEM